MAGRLWIFGSRHAPSVSLSTRHPPIDASSFSIRHFVQTMAGVFIRRAILSIVTAQHLSSHSVSVASFVPLLKYAHLNLGQSTQFVLDSHPYRQLHRTEHPLLSLRQTMYSSTENEPNRYIDKLALILINSKRQQLVARSYNRTVFYTPGGKREAGESDTEALIRECREELSIDLLSSTITPAVIEPYGTFEAQAYGKPVGTVVRLTCFRISPRDAELELEHLVKASQEVEELYWIDSSFDRERLTVTGIMILEDLKQKELID
jgi:8-oxo-dGTP diphosphatase